jgi:penicillin amidase
MDFYSRVVFGRIAEVVGEMAIDFDRQNRRIGLKSMVIDFHDRIMENPESARLLESYTAGVNAYINNLSPADYPIEFKLLDYKPEEWTTQKSCMAYGLLANTLSKGEADLENTNALKLLGRDMFDMLFPDQLGNLDPIFPTDTEWDFDPVPVEKPENLEYPLISTKQAMEKQDRIIGSNNFAVDSTKSKSGNAILANEPDLQLTQPSIWYATHLVSPNINVMGVTVPGTFAILIGFNEQVAWGVTNSPRDQVDWYSIRFKDESREEYWYNEQWFKTEKVVERIEVKGESTIYDTIVYVHHGPVVYDKNFMGDGEKVNYAMNWLAHRENTTYDAMFGLNTAKNYEDFKAAMVKFTGPPQNVIFASIDGTIAMHAPGKFPIKWEEQGKFLMDGSDPRHEWKDLIPFEHEMSIKNPERGFISSANQHQVDSTYPYYVYDHNFEKYRNRRINDRLRTLTDITPQDMMKLQNDNFNYVAYEILDSLLAYVDSASLTTAEYEYYDMLQEWDYFTNPDQKAPSVFQLWWDQLYKITWDEFDTVSIAIDKPDTYTTSYLLKNNKDLPFFDYMETPATENAVELTRIAFDMALDSLENWKKENNEDFSWYQFKNTRINHLLGLEPFSLERVRIGGYGKIVNAAGKTAGPSWRMVVELDAAGIKAWGVYPGSQTGNPGNPDYGSMIENWAKGTYYSLNFSSQPLQDEVIHEVKMSNQ